MTQNLNKLNFLKTWNFLIFWQLKIGELNKKSQSQIFRPKATILVEMMLNEKMTSY